MNIEVIDQKGGKVEELKVSNTFFAAPPNEALVHQALTYYLSSRHQGTHAAKTRSEVSGGGHKPWKQKGTGRARSGSNRSPLWRHGGVIFPPQVRDHSIDMPKRMRRSALANVVSSRLAAGKLLVVSELKLASPKTKEFLKVVKDLKLEGQKLLFIYEGGSAELERAARNLNNLKLVTLSQMNIFDLLEAETVVVTKAAVSKMAEGWC